MADDYRFDEDGAVFSDADSQGVQQPQYSTALSGSDVWTPELAIQSGRDTGNLIQLPLPSGSDHEQLVEPYFVSAEIEALKRDLSDLPLLQQYRLKLDAIMARLTDGIGVALRQDREAGNLFNFVPVGMALGISAYFAAPAEPSAMVLFASMMVALLALLKIRSRGLLHLLVCSAFVFFCGMGVAKIQIERTSMPIPLSDMTARIEGVVLAIDQNRRGSPRYLIRPTGIDGLEHSELPRQIRLSASRTTAVLQEGDTITGLARLAPLSGPAFPGGYDFAFASRMRGLGMTGFFMGAPEKSTTDAISKGSVFSEGLSSSTRIAVQRIRRNVSERIRAGLPGEPGDIAVALVTGDRSGLSEETQESLRRSGLAHILAISGLHMALVTLTVIWLVRLILAAVPGLVDRFPVKKAAIIAGFATATAYLFLSGQSIATQRAWLMISVMLIASLLDRRAITMRSVAIAAILILLVSPASLFQPGFQMSFAAVAALVAVYREWSDYRSRRLEPENSRLNQGILTQTVLKATGYFGGLATTSLIAGIATALFALWHFHRVAPLGLLSNLAAMPIVSVAVMPLALMAMFLMPYGFEQLALKPLGIAINAVLHVSAKVNAFGMDFDAGLQPIAVLVCAAFFLVFACCLRTWLRWISLVPLVVLIASVGQPVRSPDILIAHDGRALAISTQLLDRSPDGQGWKEPGYSLLYPKRSAFITEIWQRAYLPNRTFDALPADMACNNDQCELLVKHPVYKWISVVYDPDILPSACDKADILIAPRLWWVRCKGNNKPKVILKRSDLEARGSHALYLGLETLHLETAWHTPQSAFEANQAARSRHNRLLASRDAASGITSPTKGSVHNGSAAFYQRPWQKRFDNISRRFAK